MKYETVKRVEFTPSMKKTHTILIPGMLPIHFELGVSVFARYGYKLEPLKNEGRAVIDAGLKYVHNDTCYPALLCIGQLIDALESGKYDLNRTAVMIMQTGGGCRASNYIHLLRKALVRAGYANIPVISLNLSGLEKCGGFKITPGFIISAFYALLYADTLMLLENQVKPYELNNGDAELIVKTWVGILGIQLARFRGMSRKELRRNLQSIVRDFAGVPVANINRVRVGVVGEIYAKFSALANNHLTEFLASQNCEVMMPGVANFMAFKVDNRIEDIKLYGPKPLKKLFLKGVLRAMVKRQHEVIKALEGTRFVPPATYPHVKQRLRGILGYGCKMGEGWMLAAEMIELIENGYKNIVCCQPFGCLPNHIVGRGILRKLIRLFPEANIVPIDYDPGATRVNQENRIKLMLSIAKERL